LDRMNKMISRNSRTLILIGRIALASLFLLGGVNKVLNYSMTLKSMQDVGLEPAALLLPLVIALEVGGGIIIILGRRFVPLAALSLAVFTLATNFAFHDFWTMEGERAALELSLFFKNVSIAGALVFLAGISLNKK